MCTGQVIGGAESTTAGLQVIGNGIIITKCGITGITGRETEGHDGTVENAQDWFFSVRMNPQDGGTSSAGNGGNCYAPRRPQIFE